MELQISIQNTSSPLFLGAKMEENGKQGSTANWMYVNENSMDIEVIHKQEVVVGDQLFYADEVLITNNLDKRMTGQLLRYHAIHDVDVFLYHPQQLSQMHLPFRGKEWYFLIPACQKYTEGVQCNSSDSDGYWEPYGTDALIHKDGKLIGYRKTLNYIEGKHEKDRKQTEWLMHEYTRDRSTDDKQWVLCKLFKSGDKFSEAENKVTTKFAGPSIGVSSMDHTIQGPEKADDLTDDKRPSNGRSCDLHPLPETDQGTMKPHSSSKLLDQASKILRFDKVVTYSLHQHEQGTIFPTPKPQHVQRTTVTPPPASDKGFMLSHLPNEKFHPVHDQGTRVSPRLPQNDQRTVSRTSTGPHKANNAVVDKVPSNCLNFDLHPLDAVSQGLVIPSCSKKKIDGTIASHWREHGPMLPCRPQHGQQKVPPELQYDQQTMVPLSGIHNVNNDEIIDKPPMLNHHHDALDLPSSDQVPKLPPVDGSPHGSHENEAIVALRYGGWPFCTAKRLPPLDGPFQSLTEQELVFFDKPGPEYSQANANKKKRPRND